jgi:hypothetical protein
VVDDADRDHHVEGGDLVHGLRRDRPHFERAPVSKARPCRFDIGGIVVEAEIVDLLRQGGEDVAGTASDIEHALAGRDPQKLAGEPAGSVASRYKLAKAAIDARTGEQATRIDHGRFRC